MDVKLFTEKYQEFVDTASVGFALIDGDGNIVMANQALADLFGYSRKKLVKNEFSFIDCFAGGFTTAKVCADLKRKFICGDVSPVACKVGAKRLNKAEFFDYEIKGMYQTEDEFRNMNPHVFADMICDLMG